MTAIWELCQAFWGSISVRYLRLEALRTAIVPLNLYIARFGWKACRHQARRRAR